MLLSVPVIRGLIDNRRMVHLPGNAGAGKNRMRAGKRSNMIALALFYLYNFTMKTEKNDERYSQLTSTAVTTGETRCCVWTKGFTCSGRQG